MLALWRRSDSYRIPRRVLGRFSAKASKLALDKGFLQSADEEGRAEVSKPSTFFYSCFFRQVSLKTKHFLALFRKRVERLESTHESI